MSNTEDFIKHCQKIITKYETGKKSLTDAAKQIRTSLLEYPFSESVHPMVSKIADLAFDISQDFQSENENKADWAILTKTLSNYETGNWEPTCWILSAMYGEHAGSKLTHSYSVAVRRQNGETVIDTASDEIESVISKATEKLNSKQTDERYLLNLERFIPTKIGKYKFVSVEVREYLTEPYYSLIG